MWVRFFLNLLFLFWEWNAGLMLFWREERNDEVYQFFMLCPLLISHKICPLRFFWFWFFWWFFLFVWCFFVCLVWWGFFLELVHSWCRKGLLAKNSNCNIVTSINMYCRVVENFALLRRSWTTFTCIFIEETVEGNFVTTVRPIFWSFVFICSTGSWLVTFT